MKLEFSRQIFEK